MEPKAEGGRYHTCALFVPFQLPTIVYLCALSTCTGSSFNEKIPYVFRLTVNIRYTCIRSEGRLYQTHIAQICAQDALGEG